MFDSSLIIQACRQYRENTGPTAVGFDISIESCVGPYFPNTVLSKFVKIKRDKIR